MFIRKKTKARIKLSIILSSILLSIVLISLYINGNIKKGTIIAEINEKTIYLNDVINRVSFILGEEVTEETIKSVPEEVLEAILVESYIDDKIYKDALKENFDNNKKIKNAVEQYKKQLVINAFLEDIGEKEATEEKVKQKYEELSELLKDKEERKIKHILVDSELDAKRVIRDIRRTGSFERIAKRKSLDKATAENGGEIGYVLEDQLDPDFASVAFILDKGVLSKPVETKYGWHVIKVDDIRNAKPADFEEVKDQIKFSLMNQAEQNYLHGIEENVDVKILIDILDHEILEENEIIEEGYTTEDFENNNSKVEGSILSNDIINEPSYVDDKIKKELEREKAAAARRIAKQKATAEKAAKVIKENNNSLDSGLKSEKLEEKTSDTATQKNFFLKTDEQHENKTGNEEDVKQEANKISDLIKNSDNKNTDAEEVEL